MKIVGLLSGGKDSIYGLMQCAAAGHNIVSIATLYPPTGIEESDSHMYQSIAVRHVGKIAEALGDNVKFFSRNISGKSVNVSADYSTPIENDEVEDLFKLLSDVKADMPEVGGVSVGAILSDYQRKRVEHVCSRLGLVCFSYLWQRYQNELLSEMKNTGVDAVLVKVAGAGLIPSKHCGKTLIEMTPVLTNLNNKFGLHVCGEGGEFETFTLDCPLFERRLRITSSELVEEKGDVGYLLLKEINFENKENFDHNLTMQDRALKAGVRTPKDFIDKYGSDDCPEMSNIHVVMKEKIAENLVDIAPGGMVVVPSNNEYGIWSASGWSGDCVKSVFQKLKESLAKHDITLSSSTCEVKAYVRSLSEYAEFNAIYRQYFGYNPPVRACVQVPSSYRCRVDLIGTSKPRRVLHVQSVSQWAPANIGPYSQACRINSVTFLAGMIGMIPGSLDLVSPQSGPQTELSMRHIDRVLAASAGTDRKHAVFLMVVFISNAESSTEPQQILYFHHFATLYLKVERLPKDAAIELHATAHADAANKKVLKSEKEHHNQQQIIFDDGTEVQVFVFTSGIKDLKQEQIENILIETNSSVKNQAGRLGIITIYYRSEALKLAQDIVKSISDTTQDISITSVPVVDISHGSSSLAAVINWYPCSEK